MWAAFCIPTLHAQQSIASPIIGLSQSPTNPHYAIVRENGAVEVVNYVTGAGVGTYFVPLPFQDITELRPDGYRARTIAYSPDGNNIAIAISIGSTSGQVYLLDWTAGEIKLAHSEAELDAINDMSWSPDSNRLVLALQYGTLDQIMSSSVKILDINTGMFEKSLTSISRVDNYSIGVVDWSQSGVIAYAVDSSLFLWDSYANAEVGTLSASDTIFNAAWSPDTHRIATLNANRTIEIWDLEYGLEQPVETLNVVADTFRSRTMSWLNNDLLAADFWTDIYVWNVTRATLEEVFRLEDRVSGIGDIDSELVYAGTYSVGLAPLTDLGTPTPTPFLPLVNGLLAELYANPALEGTPAVTRLDPQVAFNWLLSDADPAVGSDFYSIRWSGLVEPLYDEEYTFTIGVDDGARLWVDGQLIIDQWIPQGYTEHSGAITLAAGQRVPIVVEYFENQGSAAVNLFWESASQPREIVPQARLFAHSDLPTATATPTQTFTASSTSTRTFTPTATSAPTRLQPTATS
jgi:hypothetical protein